MKVTFGFWQDYREWFKHRDYEWLNFVFFAIDYEHAPYKEEDTLHLALLGFHFTIHFWKKEE